VALDNRQPPLPKSLSVHPHDETCRHFNFTVNLDFVVIQFPPPAQNPVVLTWWLPRAVSSEQYCHNNILYLTDVIV
jgi:hypothetical protein